MQEFSQAERRLTFEAVAASMQARAGYLKPQDVQVLERRARALADGNALRAAALRFVETYDAVRRQPDALREAGAALARDVDRIWRVDPPDMDRRDIYG